MIIKESNVDRKQDNDCSPALRNALEEEAGTTGLLPESTSAGMNLREICIHEDGVSTILGQRWMACYMLYDWNIHHANMAYCNNKCMWVEQAYKRLEGASIDGESVEKTMTDTFNQILLEDVEDFIQTHMRVGKCDRLAVEMQVVKAEAELFSKQET